jgi:hypothetical protein
MGVYPQTSAAAVMMLQFLMDEKGRCPVLVDRTEGTIKFKDKLLERLNQTEILIWTSVFERTLAT